MADPRFGVAIWLFNGEDWYACHDLLEELWHETAGPMQPVLQGILQIAVAELHLEKSNIKGATILMGEGLGRLRSSVSEALGLNLYALRAAALLRLQTLQSGGCLDHVPFPKLIDVQVSSQERIGGTL